MERKFEIATRTLRLRMSSDLTLDNMRDTRRWSVREERLLTVHVIVSLLKACKVAVVWIECHDAIFYAVSRRYIS